MENAQKMKRYLHVTVWKKMEVIRMDIPAFGRMQICSLNDDKDMNAVSLLLKILVLSVIIQSKSKNPQTPLTSNTSSTN